MLLYRFERLIADVSKPNGSLGVNIVKHLKDNDFVVTLFTRNPEKTKSTFPGLQTIQANYNSIDELTTTLRDGAGKQDALIILIGREEDQAQINLIDAAIAVGISHIIPSAFGQSTTWPGMRDYPVLDSKARMEDHLIRKAEEGHVTYTQIQTSAFLDWGLETWRLPEHKGSKCSHDAVRWWRRPIVCHHS